MLRGPGAQTQRQNSLVMAVTVESNRSFTGVICQSSPRRVPPVPFNAERRRQKGKQKRAAPTASRAQSDVSVAHTLGTSK
eukprot:3662930-Prymnesium_polylepis.1